MQFFVYRIQGKLKIYKSGKLKIQFFLSGKSLARADKTLEILYC